jgi:two-component system KDP operon response regulator KdpE
MAVEQKHKVLVVDDDPDIRRLVETVLQRDGFISSSASSSAELFKKLPQFKPELIILDLQLPDEDGSGSRGQYG